MNRLLFIIFTVLVGLDVAFGVSLVRIWPGVLVMHFLDVGQGDAVLIVTPEGNRILVDGGPGNAVLSEIAGVLPVGSSRIDLVVLTHPHADHMEGLIYVLDRFEVGAVLVSLPESSGAMYSAFLSRLKGREVYLAESSTDFKFGGTLIDVLYPFEPVGTIENLNNASVVMRVSSGEARILLTGDAEMEVEGDLAGEDLEADLMKAGHH
ncbi:MBL fold metallo-hydrolase, partial [Patescibacteria group bacterium]|nr:MBL fold metallo-hydrolase [Patescibacteria group bacterium]